MKVQLEKRTTSRIDGVGIFANNAIVKNKEFYKVPLDVIYSEPKARCARIGDGKYVSDNKILNWVNHSCDPNSRLNIDQYPPVLISVRDISAGEEITVDYNITELHNNKIKCSCKSENCKGWFYIT